MYCWSWSALPGALVWLALLAFITQELALCRSLEVVAARYSRGVMLLADTAGLQGRSRLLVVSRDLTSPPAATATGSSTGISGLQENVTELEVLLPGGAPSSATGTSLVEHERA